MPSTLQTLRQATPPTNVGWSGEIFAEILSIQQFFPESSTSYLEFTIADSTATDTFKIWHGSPEHLACGRLELLKGDFISIKGLFHRDSFGLHLNQAALELLKEEQIKDLLAGSPEQRIAAHKNYEFVTEVAAGLTDPRLRLLCETFLEQYGEPFQRAAAARSFHHAHRGGLLAHTAHMLRSALGQQEAYPELNWNLIKAGVLLHDCGKVWENDYAGDSFKMPRTEKGELLGHITIGIALVTTLWNALTERDEFKTATHPPTEKIYNHLLHLIASHHGQLDYGSPVTPKTPEAWMLNTIDSLNAKVEGLHRTYAEKPQVGPGIYARCPPLDGYPVAPLAQFSSQPAISR